MSEVLWELPEPSSGRTAGPEFIRLPMGKCELSLHVEDINTAEARRVVLLFEGVLSYKCTYQYAVSAKMIEAAYDKLVSLGATPWLAEVSEPYLQHCKSSKEPPNKLQHLMIYFDDGPCYEIICASFREITGPVAASKSRASSG